MLVHGHAAAGLPCFLLPHETLSVHADSGPLCVCRTDRTHPGVLSHPQTLCVHVRNPSADFPDNRWRSTNVMSCGVLCFSQKELRPAGPCSLHVGFTKLVLTDSGCVHFCLLHIAPPFRSFRCFVPRRVLLPISHVRPLVVLRMPYNVAFWESATSLGCGSAPALREAHLRPS